MTPPACSALRHLSRRRRVRPRAAAAGPGHGHGIAIGVRHPAHAADHERHHDREGRAAGRHRATDVLLPASLLAVSRDLPHRVGLHAARPPRSWSDEDGSESPGRVSVTRAEWRKSFLITTIPAGAPQSRCADRNGLPAARLALRGWPDPAVSSPAVSDASARATSMRAGAPDAAASTSRDETDRSLPMGKAAGRLPAGRLPCGAREIRRLERAADVRPRFLFAANTFVQDVPFFLPIDTSTSQGVRT